MDGHGGHVHNALPSCLLSVAHHAILQCNLVRHCDALASQLDHEAVAYASLPN